jgi:hypothetical protein
VVADPTISGHPARLLEHDVGPPTLVTVCASCGELRTILFLRRDRWFCTRCRAEGAAPPNLYPVA